MSKRVFEAYHQAGQAPRGAVGQTTIDFGSPGKGFIGIYLKKSIEVPVLVDLG